MISSILFFIPDSYALFLQILQIGLVGVSIILISRLLGIKKSVEKIIFYLFLSCSYSFIVFSLFLEQYIISSFYLILFIYISLNGKQYQKAIFIGAVGTMLTSGVLLPLLFKKT